MRPLRTHLQLGEEIRVRVQELLSPWSAIVEWEGRLARIENRTGQAWTLGESLKVCVVSLDPLQFRMISSNEKPREARQIPRLEKRV
ncbi:MAG: hypothetical protein WCH11_03165 [Bdellovibrio sp.]